MVLGMLLSGFRSLDVEERSRGFRVAEGNFSQTALDDKLLTLGLGLCGLDCTLNLLLHALHMVVTIASISTWSEPAVRLEQIGLGELVCRLMWVLTSTTTNLAHHVVVEVLGDSCFRASLVQVASRSHELLELDAGNKVLVLWRHQAVVLCE